MWQDQGGDKVLRGMSEAKDLGKGTAVTDPCVSRRKRKGQKGAYGVRCVGRNGYRGNIRRRLAVSSHFECSGNASRDVVERLAGSKGYD